jgi:hypothetical protein
MWHSVKDFYQPVRVASGRFMIMIGCLNVLNAGQAGRVGIMLCGVISIAGSMADRTPKIIFMGLGAGSEMERVACFK